MRELIEGIFVPAFGADMCPADRDGALVVAESGRLVFTTDSYVVRPLFFPGGDIGTLAINGTVNDLAVCGAKPLVISAAFVLEEGLPVATLKRIAQSMAEAARLVGVRVVTGDTKVVERGKGDGVYVTTTGLGVLPEGRNPGPQQVKPGDAVVVSGDLGRHGVAVMAAREGLELQTELQSDCAPLSGLVERLYAAGIPLHCMRDLTRGGLASALNEIAASAGVRVEVDEACIPVGDEVKAACEILGLDPLYVANEGRMVIFLPSEWAERAVEVLHSDPTGEQAAVIGEVGGVETGGRVVVRTLLGGRRVLDMLSGEQLPRIC